MITRRQFLHGSAVALGVGSALSGCRGHQYGRVMTDNQQDMVGSHAAGAETFRPLVEGAVGRLLAQPGQIQQVGGTSAMVVRRVCFVGLRNASSEDIGDFKDQLVDTIENCVSGAPGYQLISRHFVEAGLRQLHLRPEDLFLPEHQRNFIGVMERSQQPFEFLLFANLTSGTTQANHSSQRDYQLTLELVNIQTGEQYRDSAMVRKSYHRSRLGGLFG
jgi:hypothetical protein